MKTATISYGSVKNYATVPARLKEFREACPNGSIETKPTIMDDGVIMFTTTIIRDLKDEYSARATGSALGKSTGQKAFEKLETISVGRALALLGYMASGEIASSEEMEEFMQSKLDKKEQALQEAKALLENTKTLKELQDVFTKKLTVEQRVELEEIKNQKKTELSK